MECEQLGAKGTKRYLMARKGTLWPIVDQACSAGAVANTRRQMRCTGRPSRTSHRRSRLRSAVPLELKPSASPIAFQPSRTVADCDIGRIIATTPGVLSREWTPPAPGRVYVELRLRRLGCCQRDLSSLAEPRILDP